MNKALSDKFKNVKCIIYDFDGVMTDNRVLVSEDGKESVVVNRQDGYGVRMIRSLGIQQMILSTEVNSVVTKRAEKLKLDVINGCNDKRTSLIQFCKANQIMFEETLFIGNDMNDYEAMRLCGLRGCPKDAEKEILQICDWISDKNGGYGVIRELYRLLDGLEVNEH